MTHYDVPKSDSFTLDVATLLSLDIPADCRSGLLANFELLKSHGAKLEVGLKAAKLRKSKTTRRK